MAQCINCHKQFGCSCSMYKNKYCNQKCETEFLEKQKKNESNSNMSELQHTKGVDMQNKQESVQ